MVRGDIMTEVKGKFVLFYSTDSIYSNFHPIQFQDQKLMKILPKSSKFFGQKDFCFRNVEQYMHACKALLFLDIPKFDQVMSTSNPKLCKILGRLVKEFDDKLWTVVARDIVTRGLYLKFSQNFDLWQQLAADGTRRQFVECSPRDQRWGVGLGIKNPKCLKPNQWKGQNWLGECLNRTWQYLDAGIEPKLLEYFGSNNNPKEEKNLYHQDE